MRYLPGALVILVLLFNEIQSSYRQEDAEFIVKPSARLRNPSERNAKYLARENEEKGAQIKRIFAQGNLSGESSPEPIDYDPYDGLNAAERHIMNEHHKQCAELYNSQVMKSPGMTLAEIQILNQHLKQNLESYNFQVPRRSFGVIPHSVLTNSRAPVGQHPYEAYRHDQQSSHSSWSPITDFRHSGTQLSTFPECSPQRSHYVTQDFLGKMFQGNPSNSNQHETQGGHNQILDGHHEGSGSLRNQDTNSGTPYYNNLNIGAPMSELKHSDSSAFKPYKRRQAGGPGSGSV